MTQKPTQPSPELIPFIDGLIGKPWAARSFGPECFDCWGLVVHVQSHLFDRHLPLSSADSTKPREIIDAIRASHLQRIWREVDRPKHGDIVLMSRRSDPAHIGIWLDAGGQEGVLHSVQGQGVIWQSLAELRACWHTIQFRRDTGEIVEALGDIGIEPKGAALIVVNDILSPLDGAVIHEVMPGQSCAEALAQIEHEGAFWLCLNNTPLLRSHPETGHNEYETALSDGDVLWILPPLPEGDEGSGILMAVASIAIAIAAPYAIGALGAFGAVGSLTLTGKILAAGLALGANMIIGQLVPQPPGMPKIDSPSPTYSITRAGNQKRPGAVIPRLYGTVRRQPDLIADPWAEFEQQEQYYNLLLCIGLGAHRLNAFGIEDTTVWTSESGFTGSMEGVEYQLCQPNERVTLFPAAVRVNVEVGGQELVPPDQSGEAAEIAEPENWQYIGPFTATASDEKTNRLKFDFVFPAGIISINGSDGLGAKRITVRMEAREIDQNGNPIGGWDHVREQTWEQKSIEPLRFTLSLSVPEGRYECRATRTSIQVLDPEGEQDTVVWAGLRAHLLEDNRFEDVTVLALRVRANETTSQSSLLWFTDTTAILDYLDWDGSILNGPTEHIEAAVLDVCRASYGLDLSDEQIDLVTLKKLRSKWANRTDVCCLAVDTEMSSWDVLDQVLAPGRAKAQFIGNTVTFVRDEEKVFPSHLITQADMVRGSFEVDRRHFRRESPNVINLRFWDRLGRMRSIKCKPDFVTEERPADIDRRGIVDWNHAWREGMFMAEANAKRRVYIDFTLRESGRALTRGALVKIAHMRANYGRPARVFVNDWPILQLSSPHQISEGETGLMAFQTPEGGYWGPVMVHPLTASSVEIDAADFNQVKADQGNSPQNWLTDSFSNEEQTRVAIGTSQAKPIRAIITELHPNQDGTVSVSAMIDDPSIYEADFGEPPIDPLIHDDGQDGNVFNTSLKPWNGGGFIDVWRGVTVRFKAGTIYVSGPRVSGIELYLAEVSNNGGNNFRHTTRSASPSLEITPDPNWLPASGDTILVRYRFARSYATAITVSLTV